MTRKSFCLDDEWLCEKKSLEIYIDHNEFFVSVYDENGQMQETESEWGLHKK